MTAAPQSLLVERVKAALYVYVARGDRTNAANAAIEACHAEEMRQAIDRIASWGEVDVVESHFDEPGAASVARAVHAKLGVSC